MRLRFGSLAREEIAMSDHKVKMSEKLPCINKVEVDKVKLTSEEDPRAVGGSENVDRAILFVKLGQLID